MFGLKQFCFLDKHLVIKTILVEKNLDLEMIMVLKFFGLKNVMGLQKNFLVPIICRSSISFGFKFYLRNLGSRKIWSVKLVVGPPNILVG